MQRNKLRGTEVKKIRENAVRGAKKVKSENIYSLIQT
jgi:hypothetical protein